MDMIYIAYAFLTMVYVAFGVAFCKKTKYLEWPEEYRYVGVLEVAEMWFIRGFYVALWPVVAGMILLSMVMKGLIRFFDGLIDFFIGAGD